MEDQAKDPRFELMHLSLGEDLMGFWTRREGHP